MTEKYTEKTCYDCGVIKPANEMVKITFDEMRGRVSGQSNHWTSKPDRAFSANGGWVDQESRKVSGTSYDDGREFYVTKHEWFCQKCSEGHKSFLTSGRKLSNILMIGGAILLSVVIMAFII